MTAVAVCELAEATRMHRDSKCHRFRLQNGSTRRFTGDDKANFCISSNPADRDRCRFITDDAETCFSSIRYFERCLNHERFRR